MRLVRTAITLAEAKAFVAVHHRHHPRSPCGHLFSLGLTDGAALRGVAIVGRPSNKTLDANLWAEVTRLCVAPGSLRGACSQLYAAAARQLSAWNHRRPAEQQRLVLCTYTLASESGASLRGAGWVPVELPADSSARRGRRAPGAHKQKGKMEKCPLGPKQFWVYPLVDMPGLYPGVPQADLLR